MHKISFALVILASFAANQVNAQSNPKMEKCLLEAQAKGLYTPFHAGERNPAPAYRSNVALAPQRKVFMAECMKRP
jgi:hypothetical protein